MRHLHSSHANSRRGVVLLVVMVMLSLFASVALSFVFYADAAAVASRLNRDAQNRNQADVDPELLANYFMSQLLYDTDNPYSAMRGWSMARSMYGYNPEALNYVPFNGMSRDILRFNDPALGIDHFNAVNYQWFSDSATYPRIPEYFGKAAAITPTGATQAGNAVTITTAQAHGLIVGQSVRIVGVTAGGYNGVFIVANVPSLNSFVFAHTVTGLPPSGSGAAGDAATFRYVGGANPPWTAYDTNNLFLAAMGSDGTVLTPSFRRPWNSNGTNPVNFRYTSLRPDPFWNPSFLTPDSDAGGDVQNNDAGLGYAGGNNDSIWMDLGFPVMTATNGRKYKALFAPLIVDLSNKLHLWAHGNRINVAAWNSTSAYVVGRGVTSDGLIYLCIADNTNQPPPNAAYWQLTTGHVSNTGIGAAEVNLSRVLTNHAERQSHFNYKYGDKNGTAASKPMGTPIVFPIPRGGPFYAPLNFNALNTAEMVGSRPPFFDFGTSTTIGVAAGKGQTVILAATHGLSYGGFPWTIYKGMALRINDPPLAPMMPNLSETITVTDVDHATRTITADFVNAHALGKAVTHGSVRRGFPEYPPGYDNLAAWEITDNPHSLHLLNPTAPNAKTVPSQMEALLRYIGTNGPGANSELLKRMPTTLTDKSTPAAELASRRARNMLTTVNWRLDRIAGSPAMPLDRMQPNFTFDASVGYPRLPATFKSANPADATSVQPNSDFSPDWRNVIGNLLRVDLNRFLTDYPAPASVNATFTAAAEFTQADRAIKDRQQMAFDIYKALVLVCGARDPNAVPGMTNGSPDYQAARWLGQLAVNIVDYIDYDDYMTPFRWYYNNPVPSETDWVFGTELPRLVLNEVYAQYDNDPADPQIAMNKIASYAKLNLWVEVDNPFARSAAGQYPVDQGVTYMKINGTSVYQVVAYQSSAGLTTNLRDPSNPRVSFGEPDPAIYGGARLTQAAQMPTEWGTGADMTTTAGQFFVLSPNTTFVDPAHDPTLPTTNLSSSLTYRVGADPMPNSGITILLQRLAVPHLPHQPNPAPAPGATPYNPFITVDYLNGDAAATVPDGIKVFDNRKYSSTGMIAAPNLPINNWSFVRRQPFAAHRSQVLRHNARGGRRPDSNFGGLDNPRAPIFDWLVHLDRPAINPLEILHVSGYRPHELTQQFVIGPNPTDTFRHYAPWVDQRTPIYRLLEVLGTADHMAGTYVGGRVPGRINLNTIMDPEIFLALCDPQDQPQYLPFTPNPLFNTAQVNTLFNKVVFTRSNGVGLQPANEGNPLRPFNDGDITKTWLRPDPVSPPDPLFAIRGTHPYLRAALMQKIYNNVTTTSNVFAVWFTVGYFEVVDESVRPAKLGPEVGRAENRHIRHRFFAIVDRTGLELNRKLAAGAVAAGVNQAVMLMDPPGVQQPWAIRPGMVIEVIPPAGSPEVGESVVIKGVGMNSAAPGAATIVADFTANHSANSAFVLRGNPGPTDVRNSVNTKLFSAVTAGVDAVAVPMQMFGSSWSIRPGMFLQVGNGATAEVVVVKSAPAWDSAVPYVKNDFVMFNGAIYRSTTDKNMNNFPSNPLFWASDSFRADFTLNQPAGSTIGPWRRNYTAKHDTNVVLHMSVIQ